MCHFLVSGYCKRRRAGRRWLHGFVLHHMKSLVVIMKQLLPQMSMCASNWMRQLPPLGTHGLLNWLPVTCRARNAPDMTNKHRRSHLNPKSHLTFSGRKPRENLQQVDPIWSGFSAAQTKYENACTQVYLGWNAGEQGNTGLKPPPAETKVKDLGIWFRSGWKMSDVKKKATPQQSDKIINNKYY